MRNKLRTTAWLLVLIWIVPRLALAQPRGTLIGRILDPDGKGIAGVAVIVTSPQIPNFKDIETTDKKGVFRVDFYQIDVTYHYRFDKPGYQSMETEQKWSLEGSAHKEWTMRPGVSAAVGAAGGPPPASTSPEAITAYNAGITALKAKDDATAESKFKEAVGHDPNLRQGWAQLSAVELELGHDKEAAEAGEKAIALGARDEAVLLARWQAYRNLKDDAKAADALKDLERIGKQTEEAKRIHNEGVALMKAKDYEGAFTKFQEAVNIDPSLQSAQLGLAEAALKSGHNAEAATAADAMIKADPKNEQAIRLRYNACLALGDKARLAEALGALAPYEPKVARAGLWNLASEAYGANQMDLAKAGYTKVIQLDPTYAAAYYWRGVINVSQGDTADAKSDLERFLQLAPNDKEAASAREMLKYLDKP